MRNFVTCDKALLPAKYQVFFKPRQPHLGIPTTDDDASRNGPSLPALSLTARVETWKRNPTSEAARTCEPQAHRLGSQDKPGSGGTNGTFRNRIYPGPPAFQPLRLFISTSRPCLPFWCHSLSWASCTRGLTYCIKLASKKTSGSFLVPVSNFSAARRQN